MGEKKRHQGEIKRPTRRRPWLWIVVGIGALGLIAAIGVLQSSQTSSEAQPLPKRGDPELLKNVQSFPSEGTEHVSEGTQLTYNTNPPTSRAPLWP